MCLILGSEEENDGDKVLLLPPLKEASQNFSQTRKIKLLI